MFKSKKCRNCGEKIKDEWEFCPYCGEETDTRDIFEDVDKEFKRVDKMFGSDLFNFPKFDMRMPKGNGISITITSGMSREPKIEVRTSGQYKRIEPEIKKNLGIKPMQEEKREIRIPKVTEEPETEIQNIGNRKIISIKLPSVKNDSDIEIKKLEQSIEVKAFAGNKAYFKLIPIPSNVSITSKNFKDSILKLEIG